MTLFDALMNKLGVLVNKIGDEVVKVRTSVSPPEISLFFQKKKDPSLCQFGMAGAFRRNEGESISIINVLFPDIYLFDQMVQAQQARDQQILGLVTTIANTHTRSWFPLTN
jgi:hypothetical protein